MILDWTTYIRKKYMWMQQSTRKSSEWLGLDFYSKQVFYYELNIHQLYGKNPERLLKTIVWSTQAQESRVLLDETVEKFRNAKQENSKKLSAWGMAEEQKKQNVDSLLAEEKVTEKQFKVNNLFLFNINYIIKYLGWHRKTVWGQCCEYWFIFQNL